MTTSEDHQNTAVRLITELSTYPNTSISITIRQHISQTLVVSFSATTATDIPTNEGSESHQLQADTISSSTSSPGCPARQVPAQRQPDTCVTIKQTPARLPVADLLTFMFPKHTHRTSVA